MRETCTSGSTSGSVETGDGPLGEVGPERGGLLSAPPALYATAPPPDSTRHPEVAFDEGQMNHRQEVHRQFLESCAQPPTLLEPAHALLDHTATPVQGAIETMPAVVGVLVFAARDHRLDGMLPQPVADPLIAVPLV